MTFPLMITLVFCVATGAVFTGIGFSLLSEMRKERKLRSDET